MERNVKVSAKDDIKTREQLLQEIRVLNDKVSCLNSLIADITQSEEALRESEKRYKAIIENINDWIWETDENGTNTYSSQEIHSIIGYTPEEVLGKKITDFLAPSDIEHVKELFFKTSSKKPLIKNDSVTLIHKNGGRVFVDVNATPIYDKNGTFKGYRGINRDITKRVLAEKALYKSEKFLKIVFDTIQDGISILDKDLNIIGANHIIEEWHSYMMPIVGKKCYDVYHNRTAPCEVCPTLRAIKEKSIQCDIVPFTGEEGQRGWLEIYSYPILNKKGDVIGIVEHVRDITERKRAEEALMSAKAESELYLDLMAHDINNMNQITMGYLELAINILEFQGELSIENIELLNKALSSLKNSSLLIDNVKKLQREKMGLYKPEIIDVGKIISEVVDQFKNLPDKSANIDFIPKDRFYVKANDLLRDVFMNIIGNAVKHSNMHIDIGIRLDNVNEDGKEYCKVSIEDNGPGISDDLKKTLFNRLSLKDTRARGKGFGLCLIKVLIDDYQGKFWVEDRVKGDYKKGCRFIVMLPTIKKP